MWKLERRRFGRKVTQGREENAHQLIHLQSEVENGKRGGKEGGINSGRNREEKEEKEKRLKR